MQFIVSALSNLKLNEDTDLRSSDLPVPSGISSKKLSVYSISALATFSSAALIFSRRLPKVFLLQFLRLPRSCPCLEQSHYQNGFPFEASTWIERILLLLPIWHHLVVLLIDDGFYWFFCRCCFQLIRQDLQW